MQSPLQNPLAAPKHVPAPGPAKGDDGQAADLPLQPVTANSHWSRNPEPLPAASGMAHDAANLLVALGLYCDLLGRPGVLRQEHAHYVAELRHLAERSSCLLLGLTDPVPTPQHSQPVRLADPAVVLRRLAPLLTAIAAPAASVSVTTQNSLPGTRFPAQALERILVNLVRNAAQAIERSQATARSQAAAHSRPDSQSAAVPGTIRIALATQAEGLRLTVEDNGPGMALLDAAAFLAPSRPPPGARHGLGHRILSELVAATKGTLTLHVRPGRGTRFTILWPSGVGRSVTTASLSATSCTEG